MRLEEFTTQELAIATGSPWWGFLFWHFHIVYIQDVYNIYCMYLYIYTYILCLRMNMVCRDIYVYIYIHYSTYIIATVKMLRVYIYIES